MFILDIANDMRDAWIQSGKKLGKSRSSFYSKQGAARINAAGDIGNGLRAERNGDKQGELNALLNIANQMRQGKISAYKSNGLRNLLSPGVKNSIDARYNHVVSEIQGAYKQGNPNFYEMVKALFQFTFGSLDSKLANVSVGDQQNNQRQV